MTKQVKWIILLKVKQMETRNMPKRSLGEAPFAIKILLPTIIKIFIFRRKIPMKIAFFDTKSYWVDGFKPMAEKYGYEITFFNERLTPAAR